MWVCVVEKCRSAIFFLCRNIEPAFIDTTLLTVWEMADRSSVRIQLFQAEPAEGLQI
jgi:hypothetical protein